MKITTGDITNKKDNTGYLSLILNDKAGIIDDTIITRFSDHVNMVVNAGNKIRDLQHFNDVLANDFAGKDITIEYQEEK